MPRTSTDSIAASGAGLIAALLLLVAPGASAADLRVVGLSPTRAVISVNGGAPRAIPVGQRTEEGVRLLAIDGDSATFEIDGKRRTLRIGQYVGTANPNATQKVALAASGGGHFIAEGSINGATVRMLVDTGATAIAISTDDARRFGVRYRDAPRGIVNTANGTRSVWRVTLDSVAVGAITINNVEAMVLDGGLTMPLLGMSFLSRTNMQREGETLTLVKRF